MESCAALSENLGGPWFAKISRPITAQRDRGFRITASFSFRDGNIIHCKQLLRYICLYPFCIAAVFYHIFPSYTTIASVAEKMSAWVWVVGLGATAFFVRHPDLRITGRGA